MYYAIIYGKKKDELNLSPPAIPATSSNYGQTATGTYNSVWKSERRTIINTRKIWQYAIHLPAQQPSRNATASDVGSHITASDGSIWTGKAQGSGLVWRATSPQEYSTVEGVAILNQPCSVEGAKDSTPYGISPGPGTPLQYSVYICTNTTTYSWEFVKIRKDCSVCPPPSNADNETLGDECACGNLVYRVVEQEYSTFEYYWKLVSDRFHFAVEQKANIKIESFDITSRAYDNDTGSVVGANDEDISEPFMFELRNIQNEHIYSGFIKNWKYKDGKINFNVVDFRTVIDTDILLDYSHGDDDFRLFKIFEKVATQISQNSKQLIYNFNYPVDEVDTRFIADYSSEYIIVNALSFLKVYLGYYNYVIDKEYNHETSSLIFTFRKQSEEATEIKLEDFYHDKVKNDISTNQTIATIKFQTIYEVDSEWQETTQIVWETAAIEDKSTIMAEELPALEGYTKDHIIRLVKDVHFTTITESQYNALDNKLEEVINIPSGQGGGTQQGTWNVQEMWGSSNVPPNAVPITINPYQGGTITPPTDGTSCSMDSSIVFAYYYVDWNYGKTYLMYLANCNGYIAVKCPVNPPDLSVINSLFDPKDYAYDTGIKIQYRDSNGMECGNFIYIKVHSTDIEYYSKGGTVVVPRPNNLASKRYSLGLDNNIYDGFAPDNLTIYPIQTRIFEAETLSKAQIDAVYHLISNRWNENIIITDYKVPIEISKLRILDIVKVYDKDDVYKTLPISEKILRYNKSNLTRQIKLGFKKELFTQIFSTDSQKDKGVLR